MPHYISYISRKIISSTKDGWLDIKRSLENKNTSKSPNLVVFLLGSSAAHQNLKIQQRKSTPSNTPVIQNFEEHKSHSTLQETHAYNPSPQNRVLEKQWLLQNRPKDDVEIAALKVNQQLSRDKHTNCQGIKRANKF